MLFLYADPDGFKNNFYSFWQYPEFTLSTLKGSVMEQ